MTRWIRTNKRGDSTRAIDGTYRRPRAHELRAFRHRRGREREVVVANLRHHRRRRVRGEERPARSRGRVRPGRCGPDVVHPERQRDRAASDESPGALVLLELDHFARRSPRGEEKGWPRARRRRGQHVLPRPQRHDARGERARGDDDAGCLRGAQRHVPVPRRRRTNGPDVHGKRRASLVEGLRAAVGREVDGGGDGVTPERGDQRVGSSARAARGGIGVDRERVGGDGGDVCRAREEVGRRVGRRLGRALRRG